VLAKFVRKIRRADPDVIHAWNFDMLLAARVAAVGRRKLKIVFSLQDTTPWMVRPHLMSVQRWVYRGTDLFFVTSQGFERLFLRKFGLISEKKPVVFVPNVPLERQFRDFIPRDADESLVVGYVGLLRAEEGLRALVDAAAEAQGAGVDVRVLFAGKGLLEEVVGEAASRFSFVEYLGPYRHDDDIREIYQKVDLLYGVYDRSYDKEIHLAYRFCEAVNCRKPIIVAEGTHMCAETQRYGVGLCVPLGDVVRLAEELVTLYKSRERRVEIAENCEMARREFVFEHYEERICHAYQELWEV
jgi:glycosyltransferase involved in cell wall biosynthesis